MRTERTSPPRVCFTVDVEPDCPPYLQGWRGVREGLPRLLDLLARLDVPATFFTTGEAAERHPDRVGEIVDAGHELASHGHSHRRFDALGPDEALDELERSADVLASFAPVDSFRAPNLSLPGAYLDLVSAAGYHLDSSEGIYKPATWARRAVRGTPAGRSLLRVPASMTSSALRLPPALRDPLLASLPSPVVLFVHPWEMVDLTGEALRWDCRFRTGEPALAAVADVLEGFRRRGATFSLMRDLAAGVAA